MLAALPGVEDVQAFGERAHVRVAEGTQALGVTTVTGALQAQGIRVLTARPVPATLEDVFIALITRSADEREPGRGPCGSRRARHRAIRQRDTHEIETCVGLLRRRASLCAAWPAMAQARQSPVPAARE